MPVASEKIGRILCQKLGIDPNRVRGLSLMIEVGEPVTACVEFYPTEEELMGLGIELENYILVPIDEGVSEDED